MASVLQVPNYSKPRPGPFGIQFARHMEMRGRRIVEAGGVLWQSVARRMFISIPCQLRLDKSRDEVDRMLRTARALGVRFPSVTRAGLPGGLYVCRTRTYDLASMHRNFRQKVRQGMQRCEVRDVQCDELASQGMLLNLDTMERQGRFDAEFGDRARFERLVDAVFRVPAMGVRGAFVDGRLSAYDITCREDGWVHIVHKMSRRSDLEHCPNHVLDYTVTREALADTAVEAVTMGWQSMLSMDGLHEYKTRLGYEFEAHNCVIQFHPAISPLLTSHPVLGAVTMLERWREKSPRVALAGTVLRGAAAGCRTGEDHV